MTSMPGSFSPEDFPFDDGRSTLTFIDTELLLLAIEEKERQKKAYVKQADETIRRILSELKRRTRTKSRSNNNLQE